MSLEVILIKALTVPVAKWLLKRYLNEVGADVGGELVEIAAGKIEDLGQRHKITNRFEEIGTDIVKQLLPVFGHAPKQDMNPEAVAQALADTLHGQISAENLLAKDLEPARLLAEFRRKRPLPARQFSPSETELYDRALERTVRCLVEAANELPGFDARFAGRSLQQLSLVVDGIGTVLQRVGQVESSLARLSGAPDEVLRYEIDYCLAVARQVDYLELFGADILAEARRHALSVGYVSLNLQSEASEDEAINLSAEAVLGRLKPEAGRLLLRGEAGSGKSTLFRWLTLEAARQRRPEEGPIILARPENISRRDWAAMEFERGETTRQDEWRQRIPFLIRLRDCRAGSLPRPEEFPRFSVNALREAPAGWAVSVLKAGRALVLLDGIDEIPNFRREEIGGEIGDLVRQYPPRNLFLVSTRPAAVPQDWLRIHGFSEAHVNPLIDERDRNTLIEKWHQAVEQVLREQGRPSDLAAKAEALKSYLRDSIEVSRLASNPLLCAMICALHHGREAKPPERPALLCEALCQMLLERREAETGIDMTGFPEAYRRLDYVQKRIIVADIAHYMVRNGESVIAVERAEELISAAVTQFRGQAGADATVIRKSLVERSGVLREARPGTIDFIHNTIKEFLAAELFVRARDSGLLAGKALDAAWQPVLGFAAALGDAPFAGDLIRKIIASNGSDRASERARRLMTLRCGAMAVQLDPELQAELLKIERGMFPPRNLSEAAALALGGDSVVPYLRYKADRKARPAAACVRTLRLIGTPRAQSVLEEYRHDRRMTIVSELAQAMQPIRIDAVIGLVRSGQAIPDGIAEHVSDLAPLSGATELQVLNLRGTRITDLTPLAGLIRLRQLDVWGTQVADLTPLAGLTELQKLDVSGTQVADLTPLAGLTGLQQLSVWRTQVTDLTPLAGLTELQKLDVSGTQVADLTPLAGLTGLQQLSAWQTQVADLTPLAGLTGLQLLNLTHDMITDLTPVARLSGMQQLYVSGTQVADLTPLAGLTELQKLDVSGTQVADLTRLAGLTGLQMLNVSGTQVADLTPLAGLTGLQQLYVSGTQVADLTPLAGLTGLQRLNVSGTQVADLTPLAGLTRLQVLSVFATQVADITPLMDSMNLQVLIIDPTKLSAREQLASLRAKRKGLRIYTYNAQLEPF